jgi:hypothetical protein
MTALLLAVFIAGALVSAPAWMTDGRKQQLEEIERYQRRKLRELNKGER